MPQMGESIAEGTLVKWLKKIGETIERDQPLFEISTDKVDAEIPSPASGTLVEIKIEEGKTVPINTIVAVLETDVAAPQDTPETQTPPAEVPAPAPAPAPQPAAAPSTPVPQAPAPVPATMVDEEEPPYLRSSPLVRKIARENKIDLKLVNGTGLGGRVTKKDILAYVEGGVAPAPAAAAPVPASAPASVPAPVPVPVPAPIVAATEPSADVEITPMTPMRRKIAEHMVHSKATSAHVTTVFECNLHQVEQLRKKYKKIWMDRHGVKLTYLPFVMRALVSAAQTYPAINASLEGGNIVYRKNINIGIAVALDWGLIVPVIKNAQDLSVLAMARATQDLGERARNKKLSPDEVQGGTITITNPGIFGGLFGTPIINQPQVAIMGMGGVKKRVVVIEDAIAIRPIMLMPLSFDHRLVDGAVADQFMAHVVNTLENFEEALL